MKNKGLQGMSYQQIAMQQAQRSAEAPVYCTVCGIDVTKPSNKQPSRDWSQNLPWEKRNKVHRSCAMNFIPGGNNR